jgi:hypothetical protein
MYDILESVNLLLLQRYPIYLNAVYLLYKLFATVCISQRKKVMNLFLLLSVEFRYLLGREL